MEKELNRIFFDSTTKINPQTNQSVLDLTANIMRKHNILPSNTQLNYEKAKTSAGKSFEAFGNTWLEKMAADLEKSEKPNPKDIAKVSAALTDVGVKFIASVKSQEMKNLLQLGLKGLKPNPNMIKTNSEDYLTYQFKQKMKMKK